VRIGLDTSVVLRLLTAEPEVQAQRALEALESATRRGTEVLVSDLVVSEVYFALQYHYGVPKAEALALLATFLSESGVHPLGAAAAVLAEPNLAAAKPGFVDRLIHAEYRRTAKEVLTFEKAAGRLPGMRVLAGDEAG
jgi:predicted nucleic-acid-binding protein